MNTTISVQITEVINNKFQHQCHSCCSYTDYTVENLEMFTLTAICNDKATRFNGSWVKLYANNFSVSMTWSQFAWI